MLDGYSAGDWDQYHSVILECLEWLEGLQSYVVAALWHCETVKASEILDGFGPGFALSSPEKLATNNDIRRLIADQLGSLETSDPQLAGFDPGYRSWHEMVLGIHRLMMERWFKHVYDTLLEARDAGDGEIGPEVLQPMLFLETPTKGDLRALLEYRYFRGVRTHLERESKLMAERCDDAIEDEGKRRNLWISVSEAANSANRDASTIRRWRDKGKLRINKHGRIDSDDLQRKLDSGELGG